MDQDALHDQVRDARNAQLRAYYDQKVAEDNARRLARMLESPVEDDEWDIVAGDVEPDESAAQVVEPDVPEPVVDEPEVVEEPVADDVEAAPEPEVVEQPEVVDEVVEQPKPKAPKKTASVK